MEIKAPKDVFCYIQFNAPVEDFKTANEEGYTVRKKGNDLRVSANYDTSSPSILIVKEGGRMHEFKLVFFKDYDPNSEPTTYNFKDLAVLKRTALQYRPASSVPPSSLTSTDPAADKYKQLTDDAFKAYSKKEYAQAKELYTNAQQLYPNDKYVQDKLGDITNKLKAEEERLKKIQATREIGDKYDAAVANAKQAFEASDFELAKNKYDEALSYNFNNVFVRSRLDEVESAIVKQGREKVLAQKEQQYNAAKNGGDKALAKTDYDAAENYYRKALTVKPKDAYAIGKLAEIAKNIDAKKQQDALTKRKQSYAAAVASADSAFTAENFLTAKEKYTEAGKWMTDNPYPAQKLNEIKKLESARAEEATAAAAQKAKEEKLETDYAAALTKADAFAATKDYANAKKLYKQALAYKGYESYPQQKITEIENIEREAAEARKAEQERLAAEKLKNTQYNSAVQKAAVAFAKKDYSSARSAYTEALDIKEGDELAAAKLEEVNKILADIAAKEAAEQERIRLAKEFDDKYDAAVTLADSLVVEGNFDDAIVAYQEAFEMKKDIAYPATQIEYAKKRRVEQAAIDSMAKLQAENAQRIENKKIAAGIVNNAYKATLAKKYAEAKALYTEANNIVPGDEYIQSRLVAIDAAIARATADSIAKAAEASMEGASLVKNEKAQQPAASKGQKPAVSSGDPARAGKKSTDIVVPAPVINAPVIPKPVSANMQQEVIPYTTQELATKYSGIDFATRPPEQKVTADYNTPANAGKHLDAGNKLLQQASVLSFKDSTNEVTIEMEAISFSGPNAYYKLRIYNQAASPFAVGSMSLLWKKKDGNVVEYFPCYVSAYPVIMPGKEFELIYACRAVNAADEESFNFIMADRLKTGKWSIAFTGGNYNQEMNK